MNDCLLSSGLTVRATFDPSASPLVAGEQGVNIKATFVTKPLDSDGLDDSREAEEESELGSVRKHSIDERVLCQT